MVAWILPVLVIAAATLRLAAARGDLWLDEIWTLALLGDLRSPFEIVDRPHDNNHPLSSLFVWFLRGFDTPLVLRLPAVAAGTATVALGAKLASSRMAAFLLATSYLFVHYGSEARGHAFAVAFGLLALVAAARGGWRMRSRWAAVYGPAIALALLGHLLAVHVFAGAVAWSLASWRRQRIGFGPALRAALWWHAGPVLFAMAYYVVFARHVVAGGAPPEALAPVLGRAIAYTFGLPLALGTAILVAAGGALLAAGIAWLWRQADDTWALYLVGVVVSPMAVFALVGQTFHFERYFLVSLALLLVLAGRMLGVLGSRGRGGAATVAVIAALFVAGQSPRIAALLRDGRGTYTAALTYLAEQTSGDVVRVGSDHETRHVMLLSYFVPRLPSPKRFAYVSDLEWPHQPPEWVLFHQADGEPPPAPERRDPFGGLYVREDVFPSAPLSGWTWYVHRRRDP